MCGRDLGPFMRADLAGFCALLLFGVWSAGAHATSSALSLKAPEAVTIASSVEADGYVRVIVRFAAAVDSSTLNTDAGLAAAKRTVAAGQDAILTDHFGSASIPLDVRGFHRGLRRLLISPDFAIAVTAEELDALAADPRVAWIGIDHQSQPQLIQTIPLIGMPAAYANGGTGLGFGVAILDTGIQEFHEFVVGKVLVEACFSSFSGPTESSLCPNGTDQQFGFSAANATTPNCFNQAANLCTHGTYVAGIAAGFNTAPGAGEPTSGVAKQGLIAAVQIFHRIDSATSCGGAAPCVSTNESDQMAALEWVFANARTFPTGSMLAAVNMSIGSTATFPGNCDATNPDYAADLRLFHNWGVAVVVAAGNGGATNGISSPACYSAATAVTATDKADAIWASSNDSAQIALFAPGVNVLSSIAGNSTSGYSAGSGSSSAAPHVAGAIAAIRSACPDVPFTFLGLDSIISALQSTGRAITDSRGSTPITKPRIQVDAAINQLCPPTPPPNASALDPLTLIGLGGLAGGAFFGRRNRRSTDSTRAPSFPDQRSLGHPAYLK